MRPHQTMTGMMIVRDEPLHQTPSPCWGEGRGEGLTFPDSVPTVQDQTA